MLHYFSAQDMLISHTLARRFFWSEYILWDTDIDLLDLPLAVVLSAKDLIVPAPDVWAYLTGSAIGDAVAKDVERDVDRRLRGTVEWKEGNREVLWFSDFDHAGLFSSRGARRGVAGIARRLCASTGSSAVSDTRSDGRPG